MTSTVLSFIEMQSFIFKLWYQPASHIDLLVVLVLISLVLWFMTMTWSTSTQKRQTGLKTPFMHPSSAPFFGHLLSMAWDSPGLISAATLVHLTA